MKSISRILLLGGLAAAAFVALLAALFLLIPGGGEDTAQAAGGDGSFPTIFGVDVDVDDDDDGTPDNTATSLGTIDNCIEVESTETGPDVPGPVFDIDVFVDDVPTGNDLGGANFYMYYNNTYLQVNGWSGPFGMGCFDWLLRTQAGSGACMEMGETVWPDTDGTLNVVAVDPMGAAGAELPGARGVLDRYEMEVMQAGPQDVYITFAGAPTYLANSVPVGYDPDQVWDGNYTPQYGIIAIDKTCPGVEHTLTMAVNPTEGGTTVPSVGPHTYTEGTEVALSANPNAGWEFDNWSGDEDCLDGSVTMDADKTCTANFSEVVVEHTLTMAVNPTEGGTTVPSVGPHTYTEGTEVALSANPNAGWEFDNWSGDEDCLDGSVTMDADKTCTANFSPTGVIPVEIDIKPGSYPNSINLKSKGRIPVAILTTEDFDASTVIPETVVFAGASPVHYALDDVDDDGDYDLILHFKTQDTDIMPEDTEACLTAETDDGVRVGGCDSIRVVLPAGSKASGVLASGLALPALVLPLALGVAWISSHRRRGKVKP